ncbi:hypothetical protein Hs30E_02470 [Lactococcus hodotermopsidis]|uniref:Cardiolipin synthase N-terminal domain-containing protein n=2 Tax=Pseudolactococcus hodotermopsidis TaxID=2709157 RepID=A0A6A0BA76_9LACT|nr:hypothetical protein Hs30E_02470 [Lactococcus hodotermopsidis]
MTGADIFLILLFTIWYVLTIVQIFFALGTAYRRTKRGGDNGVALYGWMFVYALASMVPGLGIWLWLKSKDDQNN